MTKLRREETESAFTPILHRVVERHPGVLCAVFVDSDGECIDYVSYLEPFDAKVAAAHLRTIVAPLEEISSALRLGSVRHLALMGLDRSFGVWTVAEGYALVVVGKGAFDFTAIESEMSLILRALRSEMGEHSAAKTPRDLQRERVEVEVRGAAGWGFAPVAVIQAGYSLRVTAVMGHWKEPLALAREDQKELSCFRVRLGSGEECTLAHDGTAWFRLP